MSYETDLQQQADELAAKQFENDCEQGWLHILRLYPIADHEANKRAVRDYAQPFPITVGAFKLMLDNPRAASELDLKDDTKGMIREIIHLLRTNGKYTDFDLKNEGKKLGIAARQAGGREKIKSRLTEVREKQRLAGMSSNQIREELKASRPAPQAKILPAEYTRERIRGMKSPEIRALIRQWTASVVNDRLFSRS